MGPVTYRRSAVTVDRVGEVIEALSGWQPRFGCSSGLHPGDVGWRLREPAAQFARLLSVWRDPASTIVAVALLDEPRRLRVAVAPDREADHVLASTLAAALGELLPPGEAFVDLPSGPPLVAVRLVADGYEAEPDLEPLLYRALGSGDAGLPPDVRPVRDDAEASARVDVQHSAFAGSTFTMEKWRRMASYPGYHRSLDLVAWTPQGVAAAAATAWSAGPGRCGLLEPVGTHPDHRRAGFGHRVIAGACSALAQLGASGVAVHTPASNTAAVAAYRACGFRTLAWTAALRRSAGTAGA